MEIKRDAYLEQLKIRKDNGMIKIITGIRRCGKSFLLFVLFKKYLLESGVDNDHIIEIALDGIENEELRDPKKCYQHIKERVEDDQKYYLLLDEVQFMSRFEEVLNSLLRISNIDVYVTGSNSKFLSSDIVTEFRGRDRFVREGRESRHILELLYGDHACSMPDISEKRYNRLMLKEKLLKNIWNEELMMEKKDYTVTYTEDAIRMMDERMILKSDVERVLADYRESQEAVLDEETKELVARSRLGNVTFWVRFIETEEGYLVRRAYSHRMNIMKRVGQ